MTLKLVISMYCSYDILVIFIFSRMTSRQIGRSDFHFAEDAVYLRLFIVFCIHFASLSTGLTVWRTDGLLAAIACILMIRYVQLTALYVHIAAAIHYVIHIAFSADWAIILIITAYLPWVSHRSC
jgi:hypothetical protein